MTATTQVWARNAVLFFCASLASSCATFSERVVERSKEKPPVWVSERSEINEIGQRFGMCFMQSELLDLPIGVKETQSAAIFKGKDVFAGRVYALVKDVGQREKVDIGRDDFVRQAVDRAVGSTFPNVSTIDDIYFEKIAVDGDDGPRSFYKVYVYLSLTRTQFDLMLRAVGEELLKSRRSDLIKLARALMKSNDSKHLSH